MVKILFEEKGRICLATIFFALIATALAFWITPRYEAKLIASFNLKKNYRNPLLATLKKETKASPDLPKSILSTSLNRKSAIAYLESRKLIDSFIEKNNLLPILFEKQWDAQKNSWKTNEPKRLPTPWKAYKRFKGIYKVTHDKMTGLVELTVTWKDPEQAAEWANKLISQANHDLRDIHLREAEQGLKLLANESQKTPLVDIQRAAYRIVEAELKAAVAMRINDELAFDVISPAMPTDKDNFAKPNRPLIIILGSIAGFLLGCAWVLWRHFQRELRRRRANAVH